MSKTRQEIEEEYEKWIGEHIRPGHDIHSVWDRICITNESFRTAKLRFPDFDENIFKEVAKSYL